MSYMVICYTLSARSVKMRTLLPVVSPDRSSEWRYLRVSPLLRVTPGRLYVVVFALASAGLPYAGVALPGSRSHLEYASPLTAACGAPSVPAYEYKSHTSLVTRPLPPSLLLASATQEADHSPPFLECDLARPVEPVVRPDDSTLLASATIRRLRASVPVKYEI